MHKQNVAAGVGKRAEQPKIVPDSPASILDRPGGVKSADLGRRDDLSAEARLAALEAKLRAEGRLKNPRRRVGQGEGGAGIESSIAAPILPHRALGHDVACHNPPSVSTTESRLPYID